MVQDSSAVEAVGSNVGWIFRSCCSWLAHSFGSSSRDFCVTSSGYTFASNHSPQHGIHWGCRISPALGTPCGTCHENFQHTRFAKGAEPLNFLLLELLAQSPPNELWPVVWSYIARCTILADELSHHGFDFARSNVSVDMQAVSLTRIFIHNTQDSVATALHRPVMNEIPCPQMSWIGCLLRLTASG